MWLEQLALRSSKVAGHLSAGAAAAAAGAGHGDIQDCMWCGRNLKFTKPHVMQQQVGATPTLKIVMQFVCVLDSGWCWADMLQTGSPWCPGKPSSKRQRCQP